MARKRLGAPSKYSWRYDQRLIDHLARGFSFESFGSEVNVHRDTLYEWTHRHPSFSDAKKLGEVHREAYLIRMGQGIALGTHRYVVTETPVLQDGQPVLDPAGRPLMQREFRPSRCNASAWIFMCKNMLGWRDRSDINLAGQEGGAPIVSELPDERTHQDRLAKLEQLQRDRVACGED